MIVVDASALIEVLLNLPRASRVATRIFAPTETLHAPHLIDVEVAQVLRRLVHKGEISPARGVLAIEDLIEAPIHRYPIQPFLWRIWDLRGNASAYDAAYITLAEALDSVLVTLDAGLASVPGHEALVETIR